MRYMMLIKHPGDYDVREVPQALATRFMELHRVHWPAFEGEAEVRPLEDQGEAPPG